MNEQLLEQNVKKMLLSSSVTVYVFDAMSDEVTGYNFFDGNFILNSKDNYTNFLENIKSNIEPSYLSLYMNSISPVKLEEKKNHGESLVNFRYQTLNNVWYSNSSMVLDIDGKKVVLVVCKKEEKNDISKTLNNENKFNSLVESISDAIYKIHNVFSFNAAEKSNIKSIEQYVNSVFSQLISNYPDVKSALNKDAVNISGMVDGTLLIVDDDLVTRNMIKKIFDGEYKIVMATNGKEAIDYLESNSKKGLLEVSDNVLGIFLDLTMPVMDGFAVLEYLNKKNYLSKIPVIIISGDYEKETKSRVYNYNIADMLEKPFDFQIVKHRIGNFINLYKSSNSLDTLINDQGNELKKLINTFVDSYRYDYKKNIDNLKEYMRIFANQVIKEYPEYNLFEENVNKMANAIEYYDIGFYSIPRSILNKKNGFSNEELDVIKKYPLFSEELIKYVLSLVSDEEYKRYTIDIAKYYHENYDGTGYPNGLSGDKIPLVSQMASIIISYNNLSRKEDCDAVSSIMKKSGTMFNPKLVESFIKAIDDIKSVN